MNSVFCCFSCEKSWRVPKPLPHQTAKTSKGSFQLSRELAPGGLGTRQKSTKYSQNLGLAGKVNSCTGTGQKVFFRIFFRPDSGPPRYICFYSEKRQIHLYRPFFSPLHGLFRKKGGTGTGIRFSFPWFSKRIFGHPAQSTELDRPHCKQLRIFALCPALTSVGGPWDRSH